MEQTEIKPVGRNEPCPCGSGKKYKKCHGENVPWQGKPLAVAPEDSADGVKSAMPEFDPSKMDLNWLSEFSGAIQKLPKGQLARLQSLMQKTMSGKDVARELDEFQRTLPTHVQELLAKSPEFNPSEKGSSSEPPAELTDDQREKLIQIQKNNEKAGLSKMWSKFWKK